MIRLAILLALAAQVVAAPVAPPPPPPPERPAPGPPPMPRRAPDPGMPVMAALYDEVCLKAFPDDAAVDRLMAAKGATPLTAEQARITLVDDPGRGWLVKDGARTVQVMLELPPYHACSVRRTMVPPFGVAEYRAITDSYKASRPGFLAGGPSATEKDGQRISMRGESRVLPDGRTESLLVYDQQVIDPARRAAGAIGVDIRFVHQFIDRGHKCC